jgi:predicted permease
VFDDLVGRLAPGYRRRDAQDELSRIVVWSASDWAKSPHLRTLATFPATGVDPDQRADFASQMRLLMCVAVVLLLVACANLAGLFVARGAARGREIAVRLSIGASRARIVRQLLTESLLLAFAGCGLGLGFSVWFRHALAAFYNVDSEGFVHVYDLRLDGRVVAFCFALAILTGVLFGLVPALRASSREVALQLKTGAGLTGSHRSNWLRQSLVAGQVALSLVLLIAAGLMVRSSRAVLRGTNFDPDHVAVFRIRPELLHYTPAQNAQILTRVVDRIRALPETESATFITGGQGLIWEWSSGRGMSVSAPASSSAVISVLHHEIGIDFFRTLRIPLLEGRDFSDRDNENSPRVAIVNQTLARQLWPTESAVGRSVILNGRLAEVVGVAADIQPANSQEAPAPYIFFPFSQRPLFATEVNPLPPGDLRFAVRVKADPNAALADIRRAIHAVDPNIPIGEDMPMLEQIRTEYMTVMLSRTVIAYCGIVALCLSAVGLFSVLTYYVKTRTKEIGIRMALGAQLHSVLELVIGQGITMALAGLGVGMLLAMATMRLLGAWLYEIHAVDYLTYALSAVLLFAVAACASYVPARRAAEVDPIVALRQE